MKLLKLSFVVFLIGVSILLSGASEVGNGAVPKETKPQSKKAEFDQQPPQKQEAPSISVISEEPVGSTRDLNASDQQAGQQKKQTWEPTDWFNLFVVIFTGCLVVVGIVHASIYWRQARYMRVGLVLTRRAADAARRSANIANDSLRILQRARLIVEVHFLDPQRRQASITNNEVNLVVRNIGATPAFECIHEGWITTMNPPFTDFPSTAVHQTPSSPTVIYPQTATPCVITLELANPLTQSEMNEIKAGQKELCFRVYLKYRDVFGNTHWGDFGFGYTKTDFYILPGYPKSDD